MWNVLRRKVVRSVGGSSAGLLCGGLRWGGALGARKLSGTWRYIECHRRSLVTERIPSNPRVAVLGATGAVGREVLNCLHHRQFLMDGYPRLLASSRSAGTEIQVGEKKLVVEEVNANSFQNMDVAFFCAGGSQSKRWVSEARGAGCVVIDSSSEFRMDPNVPLVVPEVNSSVLSQHFGVIANPNCSTILLSTVLGPLARAVQIKRVAVTTFQAASGAGIAGMNELMEQARVWNAADGDRDIVPEYDTHVFGRPILYNVFCHESPTDVVTGYSEEEMKMTNELRKILGCDSMSVSAMCVRVPVLRAHSLSVQVEFMVPNMPATRAREILEDAPGVKVVDDRTSAQFPEPRLASGQDDVLVGRLRDTYGQDATGNCIEAFISGDQLLKGAALNAVQILESLVDDKVLEPSVGVETVSQVLDSGEPVKIDGILYERPNERDGVSMHRIVVDGTLDDNSSYAYSLFCKDYADSCVVARDEAGDVIGFVMGYRPPQNPHCMFVWQVGVAEMGRGRNVASNMLDVIFQRLQSLGVTHLSATVTAENEASRRLFASFARRHFAELVIHSNYFDEDHFPKATSEELAHDPEDLFMIGPIKKIVECGSREQASIGSDSPQSEQEMRPPRVSDPQFASFDTLSILKFGGSSLGNSKAVSAVTDIIAKTRERTDATGVVVSAMFGVTDLLVEACECIKTGNTERINAIEKDIIELHSITIDGLIEDPSKRAVVLSQLRLLIDCDFQQPLEFAVETGNIPKDEYDRVCSLGERLTAHMLWFFLINEGIAARIVQPTHFIVSNGPYGNALPDLQASTTRVRREIVPLFKANAVPIIPGFYGGDPKDGSIKVFGRGGSDLTAAVIGHALNANEIVLYKVEQECGPDSWRMESWKSGMVGIVHSVDTDATLPLVGYKDAAAMSHYGKKVLHPDTVYPAVSKNIPIRIANTKEPELSGTWIIDDDMSECRSNTVVSIPLHEYEAERKVDLEWKPAKRPSQVGREALPADSVLVALIGLANQSEDQLVEPFERSKIPYAVPVRIQHADRAFVLAVPHEYKDEACRLVYDSFVRFENDSVAGER